MNILYLADPSKQSHDSKLINFFIGRFDNIYIICREKFINKAKAITDFYGFLPIQTPHLEKVELFTVAILTPSL